jgi:hypothetical protein
MLHPVQVVHTLKSYPFATGPYWDMRRRNASDQKGDKEDPFHAPGERVNRQILVSFGDEFEDIDHIAASWYRGRFRPAVSGMPGGDMKVIRGSGVW